MSILDRAKKISPDARPPKVRQEEIEIALAWLRDEVTMIQLKAAMGKDGNHILYRMALALKVAYQAGVIKFAK